jgi:hypothetical protein
MSRTIGVFGTKAPPRPQADRAKPLAVRITGFDTQNNAFHFAEGVDLDSNQPVRVRLMTKDESIQHLRTQYGYRDKPIDELERYVTLRLAGNGTTMPRPRIADFAAHDTNMSVKAGGVMLFESAQMNTKKDGVAEYRAYWPTILAKDPSVEVTRKPINFFLHAEQSSVPGPTSDGGGHAKTYKVRAFADVLHPERATTLTAENAKTTLLESFNNAHPSGAQVRPFVMVRLLDMNPGEGVPKGQVYLARQISGSYEVEKSVDQMTGQVLEYKKPTGASNSLNEIMNGRQFENIRPEAADELRLRDDLLKLVYTAVTRPEVRATQLTFHSAMMQSQEAIEQAQSVLDDIRSGRAAVEILPGERIDAGPILRNDLATSVGKRVDAWLLNVEKAKSLGQEPPVFKSLYSEFRGKDESGTIPLFSDGFYLQVQEARAAGGPRFIGREPAKAVSFPNYRPIEMISTQAAAPWIEAKIAAENAARVAARSQQVAPTNMAPPNAGPPTATPQAVAPSIQKQNVNQTVKPSQEMLNPVDRPISTPVTTQADKIATKSALPVEHPEPITVVSPAPISPLTPEFVPEVTANDFSETPVASAPKGINSPARSASAPANAIADEFAASTFESLSFDESLPMSPSEIEAVDFNDDDFNAMLAQSAARFDEMDLPTP